MGGDTINIRTAFLPTVAALVGSLCVACTSAPPPAPPPSYPPTAQRQTTAPAPSQKQTKTPATQKPYRIGSNWYHPIPHAHGFRQRGKASWYGKKFHGRKTSNGETYNMYALTAAHKTLPIGTWVRVHHRSNGRTVDVRVNDRGPFVRGRIIDLSYTAAQRIEIVGPGTADVEIVALGKAAPGSPTEPRGSAYVPVDYDRGNFTFQVGAFKNPENASRLKARLDKIYKNAHIATYDSPDGMYYRVRVGRFTSLKQAEEYEKVLIRNGFPESIIVAE